MYLEHFGLTEAPFKITPHTEFFFAGANRGETLEALIYAITSGEGMVKVTGEVGAGKTMLCRVLMERLPDTVETIYLAVPSLSRDEMLTVIAGDLGIDTQGGNTTKLIRALQERLIEIHAQGKQVVALIDEAHAMPLETLEQIRLLSNLETSHDKLMQIVLFGQPELDQHLSLPHMRQLKERITHSFNLLPLPARDIKDYLSFRLRAAGYKGPDLFSAETLKLIADASEGLTRRINIYADKTLLAAYASGTHTIAPDHVRAAISDTQIVLPPSSYPRRHMWLVATGGLLVGVLIGFAAAQFLAVAPAPAVESTAASTSPLPKFAASPSSAGESSAAARLPTTRAAGETAVVASQSASEMPMLKPDSSMAGAPPSPAPLSSAASPSLVVSPIPIHGAALAKATVAPTPAASTTVATAALDWLDTRMAADLIRLRALPAGQYAIQLLTADPREKAAIESFLRAASRELNPDRIMIYPAGTTENPRLSVLYGSYIERADANSEISRLPPRLSKFNPYARSIQAIRDDVRAGF